MTMLRWLVTVTQHGPDGTVLLPGQVVTAPDDDPEDARPRRRSGAAREAEDARW